MHLLDVAQPTISAQLRKLEKTLGGRLFDRVGRNMVLTEMGQVVLRYADEIFALGRELTDVLQGARPVAHYDSWWALPMLCRS